MALRLIVVAVALGALPRPVSADEPVETELPHSEVLPPVPGSRSAVLGVEVRFVLPFPIYARPLCPRSAECILGVGGGFSVFVESRFRNGLALGGGYELGLHASESVHELTSLQAFGARARLVLHPSTAGHPVLELGGGLVLLSDVFRVASLGPYLDLGFGGELEMTESLAFTVGLRTRAMVFVPFTTDLDSVRRSVSPYVDFLLSLHAGIAWIGAGAEGR